MTYPLQDINDAIVGSYFMEGYIGDLFRESVRYNLHSVQKQYGSDISFIFTGHSLGGALAVLAAFDAVSENWIGRSLNCNYFIMLIIHIVLILENGLVINPKVYTFG